MYRHKCPKCKADIEHTEKYNQETGKTRNKVPIYFPYKNIAGSLNWKNLLKIRIITVVIVVLILFISWGYQKDMAMCEQVQTHPCEFCRSTGCIKLQVGELEVEEYATTKPQWIPELPEETD